MERTPDGRKRDVLVASIRRNLAAVSELEQAPESVFVCPDGLVFRDRHGHEITVTAETATLLLSLLPLVPRDGLRVGPRTPAPEAK